MNFSSNGIIETLNISSRPVGLDGGELAGLTFAVKDLFDLEGSVTGFGNPTWKASHEAAGATASSVDKLLAAGARLLYRTVSDELAFSLDGINKHFGTPVNSQAKERIPGGSSSGSASVVAAGLCDFALGTDTAGSVRVPAAYCGIYGLRPSYGAIATGGVLPLGPSFDTVGILALKLPVLSAVLRVLEPGHSGGATYQTGSIERILVVEDALSVAAPEMVAELEAAATALQARTAGLKLSSVGLPYALDEMVRHFNILRGYEAWKSHGSWFEAHREALSPEIAERLLSCRQFTENDYQESKLARTKIKSALSSIEGLCEGRTLLVLPTTASLPPLLDAPAFELAENRRLNMLLNSIASFCGLPQLSVPVRPVALGLELSPDFRLGISFVGGYNCDLLLTNFAQAMGF